MLNKIVTKFQRKKMFYFLQHYDKQQLAKKNKRKIIIDKGNYDFAYFDVAFLHNMLQNIMNAIYHGYLPVVRLKDRQEGWTNWDTFFYQPFEYAENQMFDLTNENIPMRVASPSYTTPFRSKELQIWQKIYSDFVILNPETSQYVENEYNNLFPQNAKILGVKTRGTDFKILKPYGHPIQPEIEDVVLFVKDKMKEYGYNFIYLSSEEKAVEDLFNAEFPNKVIVNQHVNYDEIIMQNNYSHAWQIHSKNHNEIKQRGLEYLSAICLLSRCNALIGGNNGGTAAALYMNGGKYDFYHIFNLGLYGMPNA